MIHQNAIIIDDTEIYRRQSWKNRMRILTANGILDLSIPVQKGKSTVADVKISYSENWQKDHWGAIKSAYGRSPFFEYFEKDLEQFYLTKHEYLLEFNAAQLDWLLKVLRLKKSVSLLSSSELPDVMLTDYKNDFAPKGISAATDNWKIIPYSQTFSDRHEFNGALSILDLIFNKGISALGHLEKQK